MTVSPFLRQLLVAGSTQLAAVSVGGAVGYPSVLLQQLQANDTTIPLDLDTSSWIGSIHGLAGIPSTFLPCLMQWRGRKFAFIAACLVSIIGWILAVTATSSTAILISESFHGLGTNSVLIASLSSMSEMVAPGHRNVIMVSFHIVQTLGVAFVGIVGRYLHWKTVSMIMGVPITVAMVTGFMWPESPSWLACKGKFHKSEKAFVKLRGTDDISNQEFQELISAQKQILISEKREAKSKLVNFWGLLRSRPVYLPTLHMFVLLCMMYWSGCLVILIYSIQMIQKTTHNENAAFYGNIIMDSVLFVCVSISAVLVRRFNNKSVILFSNFCASTFLLLIAAINYMQEVELVSKQSMVCFYLLIAYMTAIGLASPSVVFAVAAELMPVRHRGIGGALYIIFTCLLHSSSLKLGPYLFLYIKIWGAFLVFAVNAIVCGLFVWKFLPETKGKTLQEIEDFYIFGKFVKRELNEDELGNFTEHERNNLSSKH